MIRFNPHNHDLTDATVLLFRTGSIGDSLLAMPLVERLFESGVSRLYWVMTQPQYIALGPLLTERFGDETDKIEIIVVDDENNPLGTIRDDQGGWPASGEITLGINLDFRAQYADLMDLIQPVWFVGRCSGKMRAEDILLFTNAGSHQWAFNTVVPIGDYRNPGDLTIAEMYDLAVFGNSEDDDYHWSNAEDRLDFRVCNRINPHPDTVFIHTDGRQPMRQLSADLYRTLHQMVLLEGLKCEIIDPHKEEFMQLAERLQMAYGIIAVDSSIMHLGACIGTPTVGLLTNNNPQVWGHPRVDTFTGMSLENCDLCVQFAFNSTCISPHMHKCRDFHPGKVMTQLLMLRTLPGSQTRTRVSIEMP